MKNSQLAHSEHNQGNKCFPISLLMHDFNLPVNVGGLFRMADALGVEKLYLSGSTPVPPNSKIRKTSRATEKFVSFDVIENPVAFINKLKNEGYLIVGLEITTQSINISKLSLADNEKICLIPGSENSGIQQNLLDVCDKTVHIPMMGMNSSMNVVSATSIAVFEITKSLTLGTPKRERELTGQQ